MRVKISPVYWSILMLSVNSLALSSGWSGVVRNKDPDSRECQLAKFSFPFIHASCVRLLWSNGHNGLWPALFALWYVPVVWAAVWRAVHLAAWLQVHFLVFAAVTLSHDFLTLASLDGWGSWWTLSSCFNQREPPVLCLHKIESFRVDGVHCKQSKQVHHAAAQPNSRKEWIWHSRLGESLTWYPVTSHL